MHAIARALMHPGPAEAHCMQIERQSSSPPSERLTSQRHNMVSKSLLKEGILAKYIACHITAASTACIIVIIIDVAIQSISLFAC